MSLRVERELQIRQLTMIGKSRLATQLAWEDFNADDNTAAFVAYRMLVAEGSTVVRVGTAIFGPRKPRGGAEA